jgi:HK97 family phage major capsid protein
MAEIEAVKGQITRLQKVLDERAEDIEIQAIASAGARNAPSAQRGDRLTECYAKWLRGGDKGLTAEDWMDIRATMSTTTTTEGGFTVQSDVASRLIDALKAYGGMREAATILRTAQGNPMSFPSSDGTSETGEQIAENTTATSADPTFGTVGLNVYKFSSKIVAVPFELMQDTTIDMEGFLNRRLAQRLGRITNTRFTTGTGSSQPNGVVTAAGLGKTGTSGQTTTVIFDDLVDMVHAVDPEYRKSNGVRWMMHDLSLAKVRKLKDSQGRPIFLPGYDGLQGSMADTLLGYMITVNQDVAQMAANAKSILFGDFAQYYIRDVMEATLFRFTDSAYIKLGQIGFLAWMRAGGNLLDANAIKYYANSAT